MIWKMVNIVIYINVRVWILENSGEMEEDKVMLIEFEWRSKVMIEIGEVMLLVEGMRWWKEN